MLLDENGEKQDADLHENILAGGVYAAADAVGKAVMRRHGFTETEILRWYLPRTRLQAEDRGNGSPSDNLSSQSGNTQ